LVTPKAAAEHELLFDKSEPQIEDFVIGVIGGIVEHLSLTLAAQQSVYKNISHIF
jgi:hypothetical protein